MKISAKEMILNIVQKTFDLNIGIFLSQLSADHLEWGYQPIIKTIIESGLEQQRLLSVRFLQVSPKSPDIRTIHKSIIQQVDVEMTKLAARLEQSALLSLLSFANNLQDKLLEVAPQTEDQATRKDSLKAKLSRQRSRKETTPQDDYPVQKPKEYEGTLSKDSYQKKFSARLSEVDLSICRHNHDLVTLFVKGLSIDVLMVKQKMEIFSCLKQLSVVDSNPRALHSIIVAMEGEHVWDAYIVLNDDKSNGTDFFDTEKFDVGVKVELGTPKIIFLNKIVADLLAWIDNFQLAKEAIVSASQAAAQVAKDNIKEAYSHGSKIKLDLILKAPVIFIPHNSTSTQGILLDLGKIVIGNHIELGEKRNELGHPCVLDKLSLEIQNVKISRKQSLAGSKETLLLEPFCLKVTVVRNLSISWLKDIPEMDITGRLKTLQMRLSEDDISSVLAILQGNLGETPDSASAAKSQMSDIQVFKGKKKSVPLTSREREKILAEHGKVFKKLCLQFIIEDVSLTLFTSDGNEKQNLVDQHPHSEKFAKFCLKGFTVKTELFSDFTIGANLILYDCILQDMREDHQEGITIMMEKKSNSVEKGSSTAMIDLTFHQGKKKDMFIDVRISEFLLVLHLPFLLRIQKFLTTEAPKDMAEIELQEDMDAASLELPSDKKDPKELKPLPLTKVGDILKDESPKPSEYDPVTTIQIKLEEPDIVLVYDLSNIDTSCIFLHAEIKSCLKLASSQRNIMATVSNLHMYTSVFNPLKRSDSQSQILTKSDISFLCSSTSMHSDNIQIKLGTFNFRLAPDTLELVMSIVNCISSGEEVKTSNKAVELTNWTELWTPKPINFASLPNLHIDAAEEVGTDVYSIASPVEQDKELTTLGGETLHVELECLLITLEAGRGTLPIPLIKLQSDCSFMAEGFYSSQLTFNGLLTFEMAYYNPRQAIWEPLLEPVERPSLKDGLMEHQPWRLKFEGHMALGSQTSETKRISPIILSPSSDEMEIIEIDQPPPLTKVSLSSDDPLEFIVTKTFLEVQAMLSESFVAAYKGDLSVRKLPNAPYKLINKTGLTISVGLKESGLKVTSVGESDIEHLIVETNVEVDLYESISKGYSHRRHSSLVAQCQIASEKLINIKLLNVGAQCYVPVTKADKRYFSVTPKGKVQEKLGLVTSVTVEGGCKIITLSGCVKVTNELDSPVDVYYMTEGGNEVEFICALKPKESSLLPLHAVYTLTAELFFAVKGYSVCINPLVWRGLQNFPNLVQELSCQPKLTKNPIKMPFLFCANCEVEQIFWSNTSRRTLDSVMVDVYLRPCVILNNLLPVALQLNPPGETVKKVLVPGTSLHINHAQMGTMYLEIEIFDYRGSDWKCGKSIEAQPCELSVWTFRKVGVESEVTLDLGLHVTKVKGVYHLSLYCPYWLVNKTGFDLTYKTDSLIHSIEHKKDSRNVVLFSFRSKSFFGKKKANIRVQDSEWSEKFPLDTVGSAAAVACKSPHNNNLINRISIIIQLSGSGLTKIVTFSPFYKAVNQCPYDLQFSFEDDPMNTWHNIPSGECVAVWPPDLIKAFKLRVAGTVEKTEPIHFDTSHSTLFKLRNKYGGVFIEVSETEGGVLITLDKCLVGASSALVLNHLKTSSLAFWQEGHEDKKIELGPEQMIYFTWDSAASRRLLYFSCMGCSPINVALNTDNKGVIEDGAAGWAIWMAGAQRYLIVSEDLTMLESPSNYNPLERIQQEIEVSFNSIGFSLVNDIVPQEIMYLCMASSGVVWEHRKERGKKYRPFTEEQTMLLEKAYSMHSAELKAFKENVRSHFVLKPMLEVDFSIMKVSKPFSRHIRRVFQPGVWVQMQILSTERNFHMKINKLQLDNQMSSDVMFPVVLARVPPPRGVMAETVPKSFFEMSVIMSLESPIYSRFKYFSLLIQEFHLKVELPFIYALLRTLFKEQNINVLYSPEQYEKDSAIANQNLTSMVAAEKHPSRRDFYHHLHLSPIKMHLSFSLTGLDSGSDVPIGGQVIHLFLQSVGVTLTEVQDVVFRLGFFERQNCWLNMEGFQAEVISHYTNQIVKQLYVLVLGLDVLGNPFGLVLGVTKGFGDLFYEPIQGAVEGPGEFAEGLFYGMRSFMGKTLGGAAGAFSRITGTIGKGVASLTLDEDYQRRRREEMHKKPAVGLESFARGGKGVLTGVLDGVSGVITKPISGAKEEGVEGFFKGVGKGVVGLVTRPASGMIDFASGSFDAVMRATDSTEEITPCRPTRYINSDGIIRPFQMRHAIGSKLLKELEKGKFSETDAYISHAVTKGGRSIILASDKRIFLVSKNDLLGQWKIEWIHSYDELADPPILSPSGIKLTVKQVRKKMLGVFGGGSNNKEVALDESNENRIVFSEMTEAYLKTLQNN